MVRRFCIIGLMNPPDPFLSVVVPVFNEAPLLETVVRQLLDELPLIAESYELILSENGSTDGSCGIADDIAARRPRVRVLHSRVADYGLALKHGLEAAQGRYVFHCAVDLVDLDFLRTALGLIGSHDAVLGSKYLQAGLDNRTRFRRAAGRAYAGLLRTLFALEAADTHGIKLFRRDTVAPHIAACRFGGSMFDTELILNLAAAGLRLIEVPLASREVRASRKNILMVACGALVDLARLAAMRVRRRS